MAAQCSERDNWRIEWAPDPDTEPRFAKRLADAHILIPSGA